MQIKAKSVARILGGHAAGGGFLCRCPVASHGKGRGDLRPSLAVRDGDRALIYNCFAGCDPRDVRVAIDRLDVNGALRFDTSPAPARAKRKTTMADALDLWRAARPVAGTPAETYLRARRFTEPPPATIRFLPRYPYSSQKSFACMIAAVQAPTREIVAVQLTFLHAGGGSVKPMSSSPAAPSGRSAPAHCASRRSRNILALPKALKRHGPRN